MKKALIEVARRAAKLMPAKLMPKRMKYISEYMFWKSRQSLQGGTLKHGIYDQIFMSILGEESTDVFKDKVVADFGCGPRGSLVWATMASRRIGIDVLVDKYRNLGIDDHDMEYVKSSENEIPLPDHSVDILLSLNALDHVENLEVMCNELLRILKPGGLVGGSFNLDEAPTMCEPQTLTEESLDRYLLQKLNIENKRIALKNKDENTLKHMMNPDAEFARDPKPGEPRVMWVRATKK